MVGIMFVVLNIENLVALLLVLTFGALNELRSLLIIKVSKGP